MPTPKETTTLPPLPVLPDGVYSTFVRVDGVRYERCRARVPDGPPCWDRLSNSFAHPTVTCPLPTDGGRFCPEHDQ